MHPDRSIDAHILPFRPLLVIRADANTEIGTGHVMRCIALSQGWKKLGGRVAFLSCCENNALPRRILDEGFEYIQVKKSFPHPMDLEKTLSFLGRQSRVDFQSNEPCLVIDGYQFNENYQKAVREENQKLIVIDDYNHLSHYHCNILLNQNIGAEDVSYACDADTMKLLGTRYVLLRREFMKIKSEKRLFHEKGDKILVTMGGADVNNVTLKVVQALNLINDPGLSVTIVTGAGHPKKAVREELSTALFQYNILSNVRNMADLMAWADIAVTAGGSTCWELCYSGVPSLIIILAENQKRIAEGLDRAGAAKCLGWHRDIYPRDIAEAVTGIVSDQSTLLNMALKSKSIVDGRGVERICQSIIDFL